MLKMEKIKGRIMQKIEKIKEIVLITQKMVEIKH